MKEMSSWWGLLALELTEIETYHHPTSLLEMIRNLSIPFFLIASVFLHDDDNRDDETWKECPFIPSFCFELFEILRDPITDYDRRRKAKWRKLRIMMSSEKRICKERKTGRVKEGQKGMWLACESQSPSFFDSTCCLFFCGNSPQRNVVSPNTRPHFNRHTRTASEIRSHARTRAALDHSKNSLRVWAGKQQTPLSQTLVNVGTEGMKDERVHETHLMNDSCNDIFSRVASGGRRDSVRDGQIKGGLVREVEQHDPQLVSAVLTVVCTHSCRCTKLYGVIVTPLISILLTHTRTL